MSEKKEKKLSFSDLGLSTPLPDVLVKSKVERQKDRRLQKKEKKEKANAALNTLASSRTTVAKHKDLTAQQSREEKEEKEKRKRELRALHIVSQREREEEKEAKERKSVESNLAAVKAVVELKMMKEKQESEPALSFEEKMEMGKQEQKNIHIPVQRTEEIIEQRKDLPVLREEQPIIEAITEAQRTCVLICGETGSGKTTQIPQFLWESGYGHREGEVFGREGSIVVTEPRRVAAVSMARRVAEELNVTFGDEVGYHVRYENNISPNCRIKFATEGIILKEIQSDFLLNKYSVIVVDEAHERSVSCDILIGLLSRIVPLRNDLFREELQKCGGDPKLTRVKPLRLVIMSATMRVTDFRDNSKLFPTVPRLINVESRRFTVTNHFSRKTVVRDYVEEAFKKVCQLHKKLPPGGVLVFLCTQYEIEDLCGHLRDHFSKTKVEYYEDSYAGRRDLEETKSNTSHGTEEGEGEEEEKDEFGLRGNDYFLDDEENIGKRGREEVREEGEEGEEGVWSEDVGDVNGEYDTLHVLPLYALLDINKQNEAFKPPPKGKRLCVVATNVAETSITIPNIRYVVDCGRVKNKTIDPVTQASCFKIEWTSQASAEQRSGRAGRVGPGHCYRLYSTAVFTNLMSTHSVPEILRTPLESIVLLMKHIGIEQVGGFPFPSPPKEEDVRKALIHLRRIGGLSDDDSYAITSLGRQMVQYPIPPRFARAIIECQERSRRHVLDTVMAAAAIISTSSSIFTAEGNRLKFSKPEPNGEEDPRRALIKSLISPGSDLLTGVNAFSAFLNDPKHSCRKYCLVEKSMIEARMLYRQLRSISNDNSETYDLLETLDNNEITPSLKLNELSALEKRDQVIIRRAFIPGLLDQVARRATPQECISYKVKYNENKTSRSPYIIESTRTIAFVHPSSSIAQTYPPPEYVIFSYLQNVTRSETKDSQTHMMGVTIVLKDWLVEAGLNID